MLPFSPLSGEQSPAQVAVAALGLCVWHGACPVRQLATEQQHFLVSLSLALSVSVSMSLFLSLPSPLSLVASQMCAFTCEPSACRQGLC